MRLVIALAALAVVVATPAAAWDVGHFTDKLTDRQETYATMTPAGIAGRAGVQLYVGCLNGQVTPQLTFARRIGVYEIGATYRYDNGPLVPRISRLSRDGRSAWLWIGEGATAAAKMRRAKRLRVQIGQEVIDFDLSAGDRLPEIRCH